MKENLVAIHSVFQRTYFDSIASMDTPVDSELRSLCNLKPAGYIQEISATTVFTIDANENLSTGVGVVAWNGNEGMLIAHDWLYNSGHTFLRLDSTHGDAAVKAGKCLTTS